MATAGRTSEPGVTAEIQGLRVLQCAKDRDLEVRLSDVADKDGRILSALTVPGPRGPAAQHQSLYLVGSAHAVLVSLDQVRAQEYLMQVVTVAAEDLGLQP